MNFSSVDGSEGDSSPNLSVAAHTYLKTIGTDDPGAMLDSSRVLWMHVLAVGYSAAYLDENADGIRQDWPRIPLPKSRKTVLASSSLGQQIAQLLDVESPVEGITAGAVRPELKGLASPARRGGGHLKESELALTASWGHMGQGGITMPGQGKLIERDYSQDERENLSRGAKLLSLSLPDISLLLGPKTFDVYLNDEAYWSNVPEKVWTYTIGGYQVIKKWLSYRQAKLLGRPLSKDEVRYVQDMVRRIAAILLLGPALDANYQAAKADSYAWPNG